MRYLAVVSVVLCGLVQGCRHAPRHAGAPAPARAAREKVSPSNAMAGKVVLLNEKLRYVVLDFSATRLPQDQQRLNVYRAGQKVGELKVTGAPMNQNITADITAGQAAVGDEVRTD